MTFEQATKTDIVAWLRGFRNTDFSVYDLWAAIRKAADEIDRLQADLNRQGEYSAAAYAERDQYMESNVKLVAEIERLQALGGPNKCLNCDDVLEGFCPECSQKM